MPASCGLDTLSFRQLQRFNLRQGGHCSLPWTELLRRIHYYVMKKIR